MRYVLFRKCLAVLAVLILTATGLWAAGEEEGSTAAAADKKYVTDPTTGKVVVAPQYGGTITVRTGAWATSSPSDPYFGYTDVTVGVVEKLGIANWAADRDAFDLKSLFIPEPFLTGRLAENWDISPDGRTYTFHIRKGVNWHNKAPMNGRELTAADVEYNFHRMLGMGEFTDAGPNPNWPAAALLKLPVEAVTATDKYTFVLKLTEPNLGALWLMLLDLPSYIMPPEVIEQHGDVMDWRNLVGTGPFMLTDVVDGSHLTFTKNPDYWGYDEKYPQNRLPYVDELRATVILDEAAINAALRSGKLDFRAYDYSVDSVLSLKRTNPEIAAHSILFRSGSSFALNHREAPFNDINVRHAMQMALDNENIAATYWKGQADATPQGALGVKGYHIPFDEWPAEVTQYYTYDPEAAEKLLDEAGYPRGADGNRFKTSVIVLDSGSSYAEIAASYWAAIGVDVEVDVLARTEFLALRNGNFEGLAQSEAGSLLNPVDLVGNFSSDSMMNFGKSEWTEMDAMVDAALGATTIEEQARLIAEVDMYAVAKHWQIFGPKSPQYQIAQPWLIGFNGELALNKWEDYLTFSRLWIDSELKQAMGY